MFQGVCTNEQKNLPKKKSKQSPSSLALPAPWKSEIFPSVGPSSSARISPWSCPSRPATTKRALQLVPLRVPVRVWAGVPQRVPVRLLQRVPARVPQLVPVCPATSPGTTFAARPSPRPAASPGLSRHESRYESQQESRSASRYEFYSRSRFVPAVPITRPLPAPRLSKSQYEFRPLQVPIRVLAGRQAVGVLELFFRNFF